ncbi:hypothetical protein J1TS3_37290 [Siminovitchia fordii]|uniref:Uncharacterized protein n=1 Tax=Siminovitchia fordii TaxID=254759 RepID=A0ABQ4KBX4_9BACI|nr:hypothetical protein J1TS3_37290 [Siminovitchia fordii]
MFITGCVPFETYRQKNIIIRELREEFGKGLIVNLDDGFVMYRFKEKQKYNK